MLLLHLSDPVNFSGQVSRGRIEGRNIRWHLLWWRGQEFSMFPLTLMNTCIHMPPRSATCAHTQTQPGSSVYTSQLSTSIDDEHSHPPPSPGQSLFIFLFPIFLPKLFQLRGCLLMLFVLRRCRQDRGMPLSIRSMKCSERFSLFVDNSISSWGRQHVVRDRLVIINWFYEDSRWIVNEEQKYFQNFSEVLLCTYMLQIYTDRLSSGCLLLQTEAHSHFLHSTATATPRFQMSP